MPISLTERRRKIHRQTNRREAAVTPWNPGAVRQPLRQVITSKLSRDVCVLFQVQVAFNKPNLQLYMRPFLYSVKRYK